MCSPKKEEKKQWLENGWGESGSIERFVLFPTRGFCPFREATALMHQSKKLEMCAALPLYGQWLAMRRMCVFFLFFSLYGVYF